MVEKFAADHRSIAGRVEDVEAAVRALGDGDGRGGETARPQVASALDRLAGELLEHLGYEEEQVAETMRAMTEL